MAALTPKERPCQEENTWQHLCGGQCIPEQSRPQQHMWNSKLFVIFSAEYTAAHSLHFQHLYVD
jgi:hypothetical protein